MPTKGFIKKQVAKSRHSGRTTPFLRRLVLQLVDETLTTHYGPNYHSQCLQGSVAVQAILNQLGFRSVVVTGEACFAAVAPGYLSWGGFWGNDHHMWVVAELDEVIDLTVTKLHLHPSGSRGDFEPIPAIWWHGVSHMPPVFRYLPSSWGHEVTLSDPTEDEFLGLIRADAVRRFHTFLQCGDLNEIRFEPIIQDLESMNMLFADGHPWVRGSMPIQDNEIPYPGRITQRERELSFGAHSST
jgi:hypothetical protein